MDSFDTIAGNLRDHISDAFPTVRFSAATTEDQITRELATIAESALPAVVIIIDSGQWMDGGLTRELTVGLALVDTFRAGSDARVSGAWQRIETLAALFPPGGVRLGATDFLPSRHYAFRPDATHTGMLLELRALQCAEE